MTDIRTFRAASMQQALQLVRTQLGPQAAVLHTRQLNRGMLGWLVGRQQVEVTASNDFRVPSRLGPSQPAPTQPAPTQPAVERPRPMMTDASSATAGSSLQDQIRALQSVVERLVEDQTAADGSPSAELQDLGDQLRELDFPTTAVERILDELASVDGGDSELEQGLREFVVERIRVGGPIQVDNDRPRVVVLVGPTGVGKTTTIAKLAANHYLRERHRVGLITVDTYRIAAVEQLRTYAEIIDLPMEVVSTPREMRDAVAKMSDLDLVLIDTAGRSPQDDIRLRDLNAVVHEAEPDEVHLVLSVVAGATSLTRAVETFRHVGITSLLLTKLDEAPTLGGLWPILNTGIPMSYMTDGQNVPDDIAPIDADQLCDEILGRSLAPVED